MKQFTNVKALVVPLDRINVDTDQIIPKQFLKRIERTGFGKYLFYDWRFMNDESINPDFILNQDKYKNAEILLTRDNFGSGSSREHAPWAISDYGFRVMIAPSFADIFYNNCFKNGILPVTLPSEHIDYLFDNAFNEDNYSLYVDLEKQNIKDSLDWSVNFEIDQYKKKCLIEGLDDIAIALKLSDKIKNYEDAINI